MKHEQEGQEPRGRKAGRQSHKDIPAQGGGSISQSGAQEGSGGGQKRTFAEILAGVPEKSSIKRVLRRIEDVIGCTLEELEPKEGYMRYVCFNNNVRPEDPIASLDAVD